MEISEFLYRITTMGGSPRLYREAYEAVPTEWGNIEIIPQPDMANRMNLVAHMVDAGVVEHRFSEITRDNGSVCGIKNEWRRKA